MKDFDPYHAWLGIPPREQPPHYYRLLGVDVFEPEAEVIENAVERLRSHVTRHLGGPHKAAARKLLVELAQAGSCLLDAEAKQRRRTTRAGLSVDSMERRGGRKFRVGI